MQIEVERSRGFFQIALCIRRKYTCEHILVRWLSENVCVNQALLAAAFDRYKPYESLLK
jgi:hypothetical protein